jgi:hypothetical protein
MEILVVTMTDSALGVAGPVDPVILLRHANNSQHEIQLRRLHRNHLIIVLGNWRSRNRASNWATITGLRHVEIVISVMGPIDFHKAVSNDFCYFPDVPR